MINQQKFIKKKLKLWLFNVIIELDLFFNNKNSKKAFMKKIFVLVFAAAISLTACEKLNDVNDNIFSEKAEPATPTQRLCAADDVLKDQLKADPSLAVRMDEIESFTRRVMANPESARLLTNGDIEIPVVVNVLYNTSAENISEAQIQSQIDALNLDYAGTNSDHNLTSTYNIVKAADLHIRFVLDQVIRKSTKKRSWRTDDSMKKSSKGGIDATSPTTKLNMWVCTLSGGILGYAQFPGGSAATDGVVILNTGFGTNGTAAAPFNKGRTATHEIGHWLNLRHIWGDATCGNDQVGDTPSHNTANYGCPPTDHKSTCSGTPVEMTMNYMDYTDDACMYMFSNGQGNRMLATFTPGGPRNSFAQ